MKSTNNTSTYQQMMFSIFLCLLSLSMLKAQGDPKIERLLIGTWALDYDMSISNIDTKSRAHFDTLAQERKTRMARSFRQRKITFKRDGQYVLEVRDGLKVTGTWKIDPDSKTLTIMLDGRENKQRI